MSKVLVVTNTPHFPATSGYSQRVSAVIAALEADGHTVEAISIKPLSASGHRNIKARLAVLARLLHTPSLSLLKWYSPKACDALSESNKTWKPKVVVLESSYLAPYQVLFSCPVIFDLHNIESELISNFAKDKGGLIGHIAQLESKLLERLEAAIPRHAHGIAMVSGLDRTTLEGMSRKTTASRRNASTVAAPNGVNDEAFSAPDDLQNAPAPTAVFVGHLGWRPNIDGAKWIANEVWPLVHAQIPEARLQLIGRDPHHSVAELVDQTQNIEVHGNVASVFPYLSQAAVATAPLWTAGGTRLKILEALGTATPVVATRLGALGLESLAAPGVLNIHDENTDFADALVDYLLHPAKSDAARQAAEAYRWSNALTGLVDLVNDAAALINPQPLISPQIRITIVVPCYNSDKFIGRTLAALISEIPNQRDVELVLVDNNSTDNTLSLLNQAARDFEQQFGFPGIRVLSTHSKQGVNVARNVGARAALGEILLFTDHDDAVCPGWLSAYRTTFTTGTQIASGPYSEYTSNGELIREMKTPELHLWDIPYGLGSNCGITKAGFNTIGGFDENWRGGGDDADFFWRAHFAGLELQFIPEARIVHYMRDDEKATLAQYRGYGRAAVKLYAKFSRRGMPRSSTLRALAAWPLALVEFGVSYLLPKHVNRRRAASRLGVRVGRLGESIRQRTLYL